MQSATCQSCEKHFNQEKKIPRKLVCGCVYCEKCLRIIFKGSQKLLCVNHNVITLKEIEQLEVVREYMKTNNDKAVQEAQCEQHQQPYIYYCSFDKTQICVQCSQSEHRNHSFISIQEQLKNMKSDINQSQQDVKQILASKQREIKEIKESLMRSKKDNIIAMNKIQIKLQNSIIQELQKLTCNYQNCYSEKQQEFNGKINRFNHAEQEIQSIFSRDQGSILECQDIKLQIERVLKQIQAIDLRDQIAENECKISTFQQAIYESNIFWEQNSKVNKLLSEKDQTIASLNQEIIELNTTIQQLKQESDQKSISLKESQQALKMQNEQIGKLQKQLQQAEEQNQQFKQANTYMENDLVYKTKLFEQQAQEIKQKDQLIKITESQISNLKEYKDQQKRKSLETSKNQTVNKEMIQSFSSMKKNDVLIQKGEEQNQYSHYKIVPKKIDEESQLNEKAGQIKHYKRIMFNSNVFQVKNLSSVCQEQSQCQSSQFQSNNECLKELTPSNLSAVYEDSTFSLQISDEVIILAGGIQES